MFYTYKQIVDIKDELYHLVSILEKSSFSPPLEEVKKLKDALCYYDMYLDKLGYGNICTEIDMCRAFDKTKRYINNIKRSISMM